MLPRRGEAVFKRDNNEGKTELVTLVLASW